MPAKYSYDFIKGIIAVENYSLLTDYYEGNRQFLEIECPQGHVFETNACNWINMGVRCKVCREEERRVNALNKIKDVALTEGHSILSSYYESVLQSLLFECPNGHQYRRSWHSWYSMGRRCLVCQNKQPVDYDKAFRLFENLGYILKSTEFVDRDYEMLCVCPAGHEITRSYEQLRTVKHRKNKGLNSNGCPLCFKEAVSGPNSIFWCGGGWEDEYCEIWKSKEFKAFIMYRDGYKCLNPYCRHTHFKLNIHHINYNKKNCTPQNLITICNSCNSMANRDREWHEAWYQALLSNRYGYEYRASAGVGKAF